MGDQRPEQLLIHVGEPAAVAHALEGAVLEAEVEGTARLERAGVLADDSRELCRRDVEQAAAGPDSVIGALGLVVLERGVRDREAGESVRSPAHGGAAIHGIDLESGLEEGERVAAAAAAEV